jgi:hypothetical protein
MAMSDTVPSAVIVSSLGSDGLSFLPLSNVPTASDPMHVNGAAHAEPSSLGLMVQFYTLSPDLQMAVPTASPDNQSVSISGYGVAPAPDQTPPVIAGAMQES